jgi:hypothetical protein
MYLMNRVWKYLITTWRTLATALLVLVAVGFMFFYRIGSLTPVSEVEVSTRESSESVNKIINNPVNAPYKLARYTTFKINKSVAAERTLNALIAIVSVVLFYLISKQYLEKYAAILGTILYATSSSLLNSGRIATPNILLLNLGALVVCGLKVFNSKHINRAWLLMTAALCGALYTPGMLYFIFIGAVVLARYFKVLKNPPSRNAFFGCLGLAFILLAPLLYGLVNHQPLLKVYLAFPAASVHPIDFIKTVVAVPFGLLVKAPLNPLYRLVTQPVLDLFSSLLLLLGFITVVKQYKSSKSYIIAGVLIIGIMITALSNDYENSFMLLPFVYFIVATGVENLLKSWKRVFPNNPFAISLSLVIVALAVTISVNFQLKRYFIAWPHNPNVRAAFMRR